MWIRANKPVVGATKGKKIVSPCHVDWEEKKINWIFTAAQTVIIGFRLICMRRTANHLRLFTFCDSFHVGNSLLRETNEANVCTGSRGT